MIGLLATHLRRGRRPEETAIDGAIFLLFLIGVAYLLAKAVQVSGAAGYDFKFIWLAGEAWQRGINPYGAEYFALGKEVVTAGHVPDLWVYPPNWYLPAVLVSVVDLDTASFLWSLSNIAMLVASSALLTAAIPARTLEAFPETGIAGIFRRAFSSPVNLFFLHLWAIATLQATAINLSVGQTAIVIYFGLGLLVYGLAKDRQWVGALGLAVMLLKPQLAAAIVIVLAMSRPQFPLLVKAALISVAVCVPALIVAPSAPLDFLSNITAYDETWSASSVQSTTGLRHLAWTLTGADLGSLLSLALTLAFTAALALLFQRAGPGSVAMVVLAISVLIAFAPLRVYDLLLVGAPLSILMAARSKEALVGLCGMILLWRAGDVAKLTGFYGEGTEHFEGTRLATLGAIVILVAVFLSLRRSTRPETA